LPNWRTGGEMFAPAMALAAWLAVWLGAWLAIPGP
tara:strand:+ start:26 stop:130 length:105 start_codon:yes stop_codon:yes gene_type:complete